MSKRVNVKYYAAIGAGGIIGSILRYSISLFVESQYTFFPFATLFVNVTGCFFLGYVFHHPRLKSKQVPDWFYRFLTVGIIGSFTTFSTVTIEIADLWMDRSILAMVYLFLSVFGGLALAYIGIICSKKSRV